MSLGHDHTTRSRGRHRMTTAERLRAQVTRHPVLVATEVLALAAAVPTLLIGNREEVVRLASQAVQAVDAARAPAPLGRASSPVLALPRGTSTPATPAAGTAGGGRSATSSGRPVTSPSASSTPVPSLTTPAGSAVAVEQLSSTPTDAGRGTPSDAPLTPSVEAVGLPGTATTTGRADVSSDAPGAWSRALWTHGAVSFEVPGPLQVISARVMGDRCDRAPLLAWSLDGVAYQPVEVAGPSWRTVSLSLPAALSAGQHTVTLGALRSGDPAGDCEQTFQVGWVSTDTAPTPTAVPTTTLAR